MPVRRSPCAAAPPVRKQCIVSKESIYIEAVH